MAELHADLAEAAAYLREEADYNRSWTDGRRGGDIDWPNREAYVSRRLALATERDRWADAIQKAIELLMPERANG